MVLVPLQRTIAHARELPGSLAGGTEHRFPATDRVSRLMVLSACLLQIVLGTGLALTNLPLCDEGFYGVPAHVLSVTGNLRNPILEPAGVEYLRGIDQVFYWTMPMGIVLQAGAFKVFGFGLLVQRELSVLCGLGAVLLWYLALRHLVADRVAALAAILLSTDFVFLTLASRGRSDMISLFFTVAAIAAYLHWRQRSLGLALAISHAACALSGLVHPNGGIAALISLTVLTSTFDRTRLRKSHVAVVAACYAVFSLGWGLWIAQAPDLFKAQFLGNVSNRYAGMITMTSFLKGEASRYMSAYGLEGPGGIKLIRILLPLSCLSAMLFCVFSTHLRRKARHLLLIFAGVSLSLVCWEGTKQGWYLVHLTPLFAAFLALSVSRLWSSGASLARLLAAAQVAIVVVGVAGLAYTASSRNFQTRYQPAIAFLDSHLSPKDLVFARSEFYFDLKCRTCLRDDVHLGILSGRLANYIVVDSDYAGQWALLRHSKPDLYRKIEQRFNTEYRDVFRTPTYRILQRL